MSDFAIEKFKIKILMIEDKMLSADVVEVVVDTNIFLPAMFMIVIEDTPDPNLGILKYLDSDPRFQIGQPVTVGFEVPDKTTGTIPVLNTIISGEITSIEPIFLDGRAKLCIRGYDRTHRLMRGQRTRAFLKTNERDLINKLAGEARLSATVSGVPSETYDYVLQYNQTDWDFLSERARLYGYQFYADDKKLKVAAGDSTRSYSIIEMSWGMDLKRFEPRLVSMGQVTKSTVIGWDSEKKGEIKSFSIASKPTTQTGEMLTGSATAMKAFGQAEDVFIPDRVIRSQGEARAMAEARFDDNQSQFIKASGELSPGNPNLMAGAKALVKGVGKRFSGTYYITEARHVWRRGEYTVYFQASGRNPNTIRHLLGADDSSKGNQISGVVVAKVTNIKDPDNLGRVKVAFPWMPKTTSELESYWARLAVPSAGKERGIYFTPEVNDEVLVAFEHGDMNFPYIVGALWSKVDKPPKGNGKIVSDDGKVNQRIVRSSSGHTIILDDTQGKEQIIIKDKTDKNSIVIDSKTNAMTFKSEGDLTIEAGGKLIIKSKGDFSIKSDTKGAIEANQSTNLKVGTSQIDLQAAGATLKGTKVDVQATTQVSVQGNAMVQIQGGLVKIN